MGKKLTQEEFIEKAKKVHGDKYDYSKVEYVNRRTKIKIICSKHGDFEQRPFSHLSGCGCKKCSDENKKYTQEEFIIIANQVHNNIYDYSLVKYVDCDTDIIIICKEHDKFEQEPSEHLSGRGCPKCIGRNKTTESVIRNFKLVHGDEYNYSLVEYHNDNKEKLKIICKEHGIFEHNYNQHLNHGCPKCYGGTKITLEDFIIKANKKYNNKYSYTEYIDSSTKIPIRCPIHGIFFKKPDNHLSGQECKLCTYNVSKGERFIEKYLENKDIEYIKDKKFDGCIYKAPLRFDFYLPKYNLCIEFDGKQHFEKFKKEKDDIKLNLRKLRDQIKNEYCKNNNIHLIRIRYDENIVEKLDVIFNI